MRRLSSLQRLVLFVLSTFALLATCHPRPAATSLSNTPYPGVAGHDVEVTSSPDFTSVERTANAILRQRDLGIVGFREFVDIGSGWNMYYSTWPSVILPVRKYDSYLPLPSGLEQQQRGSWERSLGIRFSCFKPGQSGHRYQYLVRLSFKDLLKSKTWRRTRCLGTREPLRHHAGPSPRPMGSHPSAK